MAASEGLPLPSSLVSSRLIDGFGTAAVLQSGLVSEDRHVVGFTATVSADGKDFMESCLFWLGPALEFTIPANSIFPQIHRESTLSATVIPSNLYFFPNTPCTQWASGKAAISAGEFKIAGGDEQNQRDLKAGEWVWRIALVTTNNVRQAVVYLQIIPVSMGVLDSLTDYASPDLALLSFRLTAAPWSHPPDPSMKFFGPVPLFRDRRSADAKSSSTFPPSQTIKGYISRCMLKCSWNPQLTPDEVLTLIADYTAHPPSRPAEIAVWPPIPPDSISVSSATGSKGSTPAEAMQRTRG